MLSIKLNPPGTKKSLEYFSWIGHYGGSTSYTDSMKDLLTMSRDNDQCQGGAASGVWGRLGADCTLCQLSCTASGSTLSSDTGFAGLQEGSRLFCMGWSLWWQNTLHTTWNTDTKSRDKAQNALYLQRNSLKPQLLSEYTYHSDFLSALDSPLASITSMCKGSSPGWVPAALRHLRTFISSDMDPPRDLSPHTALQEAVLDISTVHKRAHFSRFAPHGLSLDKLACLTMVATVTTNVSKLSAHL
ncbi:hypothetical protein J0S82_007152, partial [Galemys pyrenaicus]